MSGFVLGMLLGAGITTFGVTLGLAAGWKLRSDYDSKDGGLE